VGTDTRWLTPRLVAVQHPTTAQGFAADIEIPSIANADLAQWIADNCDFRQLILEFYTPGIPDSGWVHVSYDPNDLKKQVMTATKQDGKTVYLTGLVA
jgi:zinc D-Ala-D-Ala carboxypeptidase